MGQRRHVSRGALQFPEKKIDHPRQDPRIPTTRIGRYVIAEPCGDSETFYDYLERLREVNQERNSGFRIEEGSLFLPFISPEIFTQIVSKSHDKIEASAQRRTTYEFRRAKQKVAHGIAALKEKDTLLAYRKLEAVRVLADEGLYDENLQLVAPSLTDVNMYKLWGERSVSLKPQARVIGDRVLGFSLQRDTHTDAVNKQIEQAIAEAGFERGLHTVQPLGEQILIFASSDVPFNELPQSRQPVLPRPPQNILVGDAIIETIGL